jgi:hypothetical protein
VVSAVTRNDLCYEKNYLAAAKVKFWKIHNSSGNIKFQQPGMYISINPYKFVCILLSVKNWSEQHIQQNMIVMLHLQKTKLILVIINKSHQN